MYWLKPDAVLVDGVVKPGVGVLVTARDGTGRILEIGPPRESAGIDVIELPHRLLMPGFVNAHSHAFQRGLRGWVQHGEGHDSFWTWREQMYTLASRLSPEGVEAISALAFAEMLRAGFTSVGEFHYLHHQPDGRPYADPDELAMRVVAAAKKVGIRIVLLRVAYARAGFGAEPNPRQARFLDGSPEAVIAATSRLAAKGVDVGLAPHSVRACPKSWLRAFAEVPLRIHAHVDEQQGEVDQCMAEHGRRPLQVFFEAGLLGPRFTAVHLTHPDDHELAILHESGSTVCVCPTTELDLGDGFFPAWKVNAPVCIGTDSHAMIDPFAELRAIELHSRAVLGRRNVTPHHGPDGLAVALLAKGSEVGARSLGLDVGRIAPGLGADLVAIDTSRMEFGASRLLPALVFNGSAAAVRDVWVGGRHVVRDGRVPGGEAVVAEAERAIRRAAL
ncbi:formimidoylglutamate deiminase [Deltaproteobacteria bacterium]|nr:formimidoylglutamate deiminase [Deltaproteobacteria bacterium]